MTEFRLDQRLAADCHQLGRLTTCRVLLMDNALIPWFILVPETTCTEILDLEEATQTALFGEINRVAGFVRRRFEPDKLNIAAIGNLVRQLHVHVIGRYSDDYAWPGVVWGRPEREPYEPAEVAELRSELMVELGAAFVPHG